MKIIGAILLAALSCLDTAAQFPPVGTIDFYGLRKVSEQQIRAKLQVKVGAPAFSSKAEKAKAETLISAIPNVAEVQISQVCCTDDGKTMIYVGIRETDEPALTFRPSPKSDIRLPAEIFKAGTDYAEAHQQAVLKGDVSEDRSRGHSLVKNPETRRLQEQFILIAGKNLDLLRRVLRESSDDDHRAFAAEIIAYHEDKSEIVPDLVAAMNDGDSTVRNNAMRALGLIAVYAALHPEKKIKVPFEPFVELLGSIDWTDRNKSGLALSELTQTRDPALLELIRRKSALSLLEMALWKNDGHAGNAFLIIGRIAGFSDDELMKALAAGNRRDLIARIQQKLRLNR